MSPDARAMEKQINEHVIALRTTLASVRAAGAANRVDIDQVRLAEASLRNVETYALEAIGK